VRHHLDMGTTLQDAQREVVLSLLPRRHAVEIDGRHVAVGLLGRLVDGPGCTPVRASVTTGDACSKCGNPFVEDGKFLDSTARSGQTPFCGACVWRCHDTEIADHWCEIDQYRQEARA
jgi:hypothetical protein